MTLTHHGFEIATNETTPLPIPRPEYPRPDRDRSARWLNLNGQWSFEADGTTGEITVPFAWETEASGVHRTWLEHGTYRRSVTVPDAWSDARVVLCFGAVHHRALIRIDGDFVAEHIGGYESFEIDITDHVIAGVDFMLDVDVTAPADKRAIAHGKQRSIPRDDYDGVSFTPSSGIWQTVWLESRGRTYAREVELRTQSLTGIDITVGLAGDAAAGAAVRVEVVETGEALTLTTDAAGRGTAYLPLAEPKLWSPAAPHLYRLLISTGEGDAADQVTATTGLRRIDVRGEQIWLNDERLYVRGILDQGYWPATGLTAPSADELREDIRLAADLGYNLVRKHLKFEEPIWLHEADKQGMLVWAEPACPSRFSADSAAAFEAQLPAMVERDGNHPSIIIWGLYNEEWGLDWDIPGSTSRADAAVAAYDLLHALDATRPIVENSGWSHVKSDLVDWHYYEPDLAEWGRAMSRMVAGEQETFPVRLGPAFTVDKSLYGNDEFPRHGVPILNSEYGEGFTSLERAWHLRWETQELRRHDRFAGYVYTEFCDVEHEGAGLLTADRRAKDWGGCRPADVNAETVLIVNLVPLAAGADIEVPHQAFQLEVQVSHHGTSTVEGWVKAAWIPAGSSTEQFIHDVHAASAQVEAKPFVVSAAVSLTVPPIDRPARLLLWLEDSMGISRARAFLDAAEVEEPNRRGARQEPEETAARH